MIDQTSRVAGIVKDELKKHAMNQPVGMNVVHGFAPIPNEQGQIGLGPAWIVMITMRPPLIGAPDIVLEFPVPGVLPREDDVRRVVKMLYEGCRVQYDEALKLQKAA